MEEGSTQAKRNAPHIAKVKTIQDQLIAVNSLIKKEAKTKDVEHEKLDKINAAIGAVLNDVRGNYNNREMALVVTKLQEATHAVNRKDFNSAKLKIDEARDWAGEYIKTLE